MGKKKIGRLGHQAGFIGAGPMGREMALRLGSYFDKVVFSDDNPAVVKSVLDSGNAEKYDWSFAKDNISLASESNALFIAVNIGNTLKVIDECCGYVPDGALVADATSVKKYTVPVMKKAAPHATVIGIHPMYAPDIDIINQNVVLTPADAGDSDWLKNMEAVFTHWGANVIVLPPEMHDLYASFTQTLPHLMALLYAQGVVDKKIDITTLEQFLTPFSGLNFAQFCRILGAEKDDMYAGMQCNNDETIRRAEELEALLQKHILSLSAKDVATITSQMSGLREHFNGIGPEIIPRYAERVKPIEGLPQGTVVYFKESRIDEACEILGLKESAMKPYDGDVYRAVLQEPAALNGFRARRPKIPLAERVARIEPGRKKGHSVFYIDGVIWRDNESGVYVNKLKITPKQISTKPYGLRIEISKKVAKNIVGLKEYNGSLINDKDGYLLDILRNRPDLINGGEIVVEKRIPMANMVDDKILDVYETLVELKNTNYSLWQRIGNPVIFSLSKATHLLTYGKQQPV